MDVTKNVQEVDDNDDNEEKEQERKENNVDDAILPFGPYRRFQLIGHLDQVRGSCAKPPDLLGLDLLQLCGRLHRRPTLRDLFALALVFARRPHVDVGRRHSGA